MFHYPSRSIASGNGALDYSVITNVSSNLYPVPVTTVIGNAFAHPNDQNMNTPIRSNKRISQNITNALRSWKCVNKIDFQTAL